LSKSNKYNPRRFSDLITESAYPSGKDGERTRHERKATVAWLFKQGKKDAACTDLAEKLSGCLANRRCKSGACPECAAAAQNLFVTILRRFVDARSNDNEVLLFATVVPIDGIVRPGQLSESENRKALRRWRERLGQARVPWFVGGVDFSLNDNIEPGRRRWSVHVHGLTAARDAKHLKNAIKAHFPKSPDISISVPVKLTKWDGREEALRYLLKPNFWRRISNDGSTRTTENQHLRSAERRELSLHLDAIGLVGRVFVKNAQFVHRKEGSGLSTLNLNL
jgi:hypothetical protein